MTKMITLRAWGDQAFDPPPSTYQLRQLVKRGQIDPPPVFLGRGYYVQRDAAVIDGDAVSTDAPSKQTTHADPVIARILAAR